jgi:multidrug resistance efflux pump
VTADGVMALAQPALQMSFDVSDRITKVNVVPGQRVSAGDVLAEVEGGQLRGALQQAQDALAVAEAEAAQSLAPAQQRDIDSAQAAYNAAAARYNELRKGPSQSDIADALRNWNSAKNNLYQAQLARDVECGWAGLAEKDKITTNDPDCRYNQFQVSSAELNERSAFLRYTEAQQPPTRDRIAQAYADLLSSRANLEKAKAGPTDQQRQLSELRIEQSRVAVQRAERNLERTKLISPCDCSVQDVTIVAGAVSVPGTPAITLVNLDALRFQTNNLTERDVVLIDAGAPAAIRLRAFDQPFTGTVRAVLPRAAGTQGNAAIFTVIIDVAPNAGNIPLPGMTGQAEIEIK